MPAAIGFRGVGHIGVLTLLVSVVQFGKAQSFNTYSVKELGRKDEDDSI